ncbi:uncharacterized protein LOC119673598 isoform X2 [Teleopsis dalmanni]|uniref:uncharacterized protein LOC119673598 isoform X2 n=1 Tax=Teleopsis dalmanni TaxID=139649 RepID=UPI0018CD318B|nr:uncharacterized protein LOC119673598 isoform X2 [Teleopsis dalmanni]
MESTKTICIKRWINLRGQYTKELRMSRELCPIKGTLRGSHWPYLEQLNFLKIEESVSSPTGSGNKSETDLEVDNDEDRQVLINCGKLPENIITDDILEKLKNEEFVVVDEMDQNAETFKSIPPNEIKQEEPFKTSHVIEHQPIAISSYVKVMQQQVNETQQAKSMIHQPIVIPQIKGTQQQPTATPNIDILEQQPIQVPDAKVIKQEPVEKPFSLENALVEISTHLRDFDDTNRSVVEQRILDFLRKVPLNTTTLKYINNLEI